MGDTDNRSGENAPAPSEADPVVPASSSLSASSSAGGKYGVAEGYAEPGKIGCKPGPGRPKGLKNREKVQGKVGRPKGYGDPWKGFTKKQRKYLEAVARNGGAVGACCRYADVDLSMPSAWRRKDPKFAEAELAAVGLSVDRVQDEHFQYSRGESEVAFRTRSQILKAFRPELWGDKVSVGGGDGVGAVVAIGVGERTEAVRRALEVMKRCKLLGEGEARQVVDVESESESVADGGG